MLLSLITLSFSPFWIPTILSIVWSLFMFNLVTKATGYFAGFSEVIGLVFGNLLIWSIFFAVMYFVK